MSPLLTRPSRADRGLVLLLALVCAAITVGSTSASVWLRTTADDLARDLFQEALHPATQVKVTYFGVTDPYIRPGAAEEVDRALLPGVRQVLEEPRHSVVSPEMVPQVLPPDPGVPAFLTVASLPGLDDLVTIETGRLPNPGRPVRQLPPGIAEAYQEAIDPELFGLDRERGEAEVVEVILETSAADEIGVSAGDWVALSATRFQGEEVVTAVLHVVGTYRAADPYPSPLDDIDTARIPTIDPTPNAKSVRATALAADEDTVLGATWESAPDVRWVFDPVGTPSAADAESFVELGRAVELQSWPNVAHADGVGAETGLGDLGGAVVFQRDTSDGMALLGLSALAGGGFAVLLAAAAVLASRRDPQTTVVRARGASRRWLVLQRGGEAALIAAPGLLAALALVLGTGGELVSTPSLVGLVAAAVCVALITAAQTVPRTQREPTTLQLVLRDSLQLVLVMLATAVTWVVVRRGSVDSGDPVTLLVAPLLGCAAAVVVLRLLRLVLRALRQAAAGTRRLTPVVSLSQAVAISQQVVVASAAVVMAVSSALIAVALTDTLRHGSEQTGWEQVGSDIAVQAAGLEEDTAADLARLPGVETTAPVFTSPSVSLDTEQGVEGVRLVAFDPAAMRETTGESPLPVDLPEGSGDELAVLVSPDLEIDGRPDAAPLRPVHAARPGGRPDGPDPRRHRRGAVRGGRHRRTHRGGRPQPDVVRRDPDPRHAGRRRGRARGARTRSARRGPVPGRPHRGAAGESRGHPDHRPAAGRRGGRRGGRGVRRRAPRRSRRPRTPPHQQPARDHRSEPPAGAAGVRVGRDPPGRRRVRRRSRVRRAAGRGRRPGPRPRRAHRHRLTPLRCDPADGPHCSRRSRAPGWCCWPAWPRAGTRHDHDHTERPGAERR